MHEGLESEHTVLLNADARLNSTWENLRVGYVHNDLPRTSVSPPRTERGSRGCAARGTSSVTKSLLVRDMTSWAARASVEETVAGSERVAAE